MREDIRKTLDQAEKVLVGIGVDFVPGDTSKEAILKVYERLGELLQGKDYFIVTLLTDDIIYESSLERDRVVAPCGSEAADNVVTNENYDESGYLPQWEVYTKWVQNTLNKSICILELGVGFEYPSVIRFPFEKIAYFNQKAFLFRIHPKLAQLTQEISGKGISISEWPAEILMRITSEVDEKR